jgi:hypothetical protein
MRRVEEKIITNDEFNHLRSQIVMSNEDRMGLKRPQYAFTEQGVAIIKSQAGLNSFTFMLKQWIEKTNAIGIVSKVGRYGGTYGIAKCDTFKAVLAQQVVSQLIQIPWGQNITKNLPDEFRSSLPSIEEIEAELSGGKESQ